MEKCQINTATIIQDNNLGILSGIHCSSLLATTSNPSGTDLPDKEPGLLYILTSTSAPSSIAILLKKSSSRRLLKKYRGKD